MRKTTTEWGALWNGMVGTAANEEVATLLAAEKNGEVVSREITVTAWKAVPTP